MRLFYLVILLTFTVIFQSCKSKWIDGCTPGKYLSNFKISKNDYSTDSLIIIKKLKLEIAEHGGFFESKEFDEETEVTIDTIVYDSTFSKMVVLIIVKKPSNSQLNNDRKNEWYFNGTCYIGYKHNNSTLLSWMGPNFTNSSDPKNLSGIMRETFFCELTHMNNVNFGNYNVNDIRFWDSLIWKDRFSTK